MISAATPEQAPSGFTVQLDKFGNTTNVQLPDNFSPDDWAALDTVLPVRVREDAGTRFHPHL